MQFYKRALLKKISVDTNAGDLNDDPFYSFSESITENHDEILVVYVGDSLTEYISRAKTKGSRTYKNIIAYWLGPITRTGFVKKSEFDRSRERLIANLKLIKMLRKNHKKTILVWSSGTIDVRCSMYELLLSGTFESQSEFLSLYEKNSVNLVENLVLPMSFDIGADLIVFLSELNSPIEGDCPSTYSELKKIKEINAHPTFGTIKQRLQWTGMVNEISRQLCINYGIKYLDINKYINYQNPLQEQFDGTHFGNPATILNINKEILSLIH